MLPSMQALLMGSDARSQLYRYKHAFSTRLLFLFFLPSSIVSLASLASIFFPLLSRASRIQFLIHLVLIFGSNKIS